MNTKKLKLSLDSYKDYLEALEYVIESYTKDFLTSTTDNSIEILKDTIFLIQIRKSMEMRYLDDNLEVKAEFTDKTDNIIEISEYDLPDRNPVEAIRILFSVITEFLYDDDKKSGNGITAILLFEDLVNFFLSKIEK